MMSTSTTFIVLNGMALISAAARPVLLRPVPSAKPPATSQRTLQLISLMSSLVNTPQQV